MKRLMTNAWPAGGAVAALLLALPLASCGGGEDEGRTASGEVLEGTISDEMLPLDTRTSQPPLLKIQPSGAAGNDAQSEAGAEEETEAEAAPDGVAPRVVPPPSGATPATAPTVTPPAN